MLDASKVAPSHYASIASALADHGAPTEEFWNRLRSDAESVGALDAWSDLVVTADLAQLTAGHLPILTAVKRRLDDPAAADLTAARDLAKWTIDQWIELIEAAGGAVPEDLTETAEGGTAAFAASLAEASALRYPTAALTAELGRTDGHGLAQVTEAAQFLDAHPDLELKLGGVDAYLAGHELELERELVVELRVQQRVLRLSPSPKTAMALLAEGLHYSAPIAALEPAELKLKLAPHGVGDGDAATVFHLAQLSYANVVSQLAQFAADLAPGQFAVFGAQTIGLEQAKAAIGDVPDLELLFGALDYCECKHCESVYGPAAYFTDLLRFLSTRAARPGSGDTVLDVLLDRRGDLDDIKLGCANTDTPLPYIDLVCEALERAVPTEPTGPGGEPYQTTRDAAELRAFPEHLRAEAYDVLKESDFPIRGAFNAWQVEAGILLDHLGVPRHELMGLFNPPLDQSAAIAAAGEYFGLSTHDMELISDAAPAQPALDGIWGLNTAETTVGVLTFLRHSELEYAELLELLDLEWIRDGAPSSPSTGPKAPADSTSSPSPASPRPPGTASTVSCACGATPPGPSGSSTGSSSPPASSAPPTSTAASSRRSRPSTGSLATCGWNSTARSPSTRR
ncbi:hypothetical protein GCM10029992_50810 [Glycomyces albus]